MASRFCEHAHASPSWNTGLSMSTEPPPQPARLVWLEVGADAEAGVSPAVETALETWRGAGWKVHHERVVGPPFWQTTEIEELPALISATRRALAGPPREPAR